ncbi:hypothetical protein HOY80DRAFT_946401 [Tuber brumale]|nr:hypothetical protein HOY80DRAFT_946401 [Tuber brumale]
MSITLLYIPYFHLSLPLHSPFLLLPLLRSFPPSPRHLLLSLTPHIEPSPLPLLPFSSSLLPLSITKSYDTPSQKSHSFPHKPLMRLGLETSLYSILYTLRNKK